MSLGENRVWDEYQHKINECTINISQKHWKLKCNMLWLWRCHWEFLLRPLAGAKYCNQFVFFCHTVKYHAGQSRSSILPGWLMEQPSLFHTAGFGWRSDHVLIVLEWIMQLWCAARNYKFWRDGWTETREDVKSSTYRVPSSSHHRRKRARRRKKKRKVRPRRTIRLPRIVVRTVIADLHDVVHRGTAQWFSSLSSRVTSKSTGRCNKRREPERV